MNSLVIEGILHRNYSTSLTLNETGASVQMPNNSISIDKEKIKTIVIFKGQKAYCLRIECENTTYDFQNLHESYISKVKQMMAQEYNITCDVAELESFNTTNGNLVFVNNIVYFVRDNQIFSIPKGNIKKVIEVGNDIEMQLEGAEITFQSNSNITKFLDNKLAEEVCIISGLTCIHPRSKITLVFFDDFLTMKGPSYDHSIPYDDVNRILYLGNGDFYYFVLDLNNILIQGQTKYESLVFTLNDEEIEVTTKGGQLKPLYKGEESNVVLQIFETLTKMRANECNEPIRCTSQVVEGQLYLLDNSLQFLPKAKTIMLNEVRSIDFSRINLSITQAKTFDMTVYTDKVYNFFGISKEMFNTLETYFSKHNIEMNSEVIEDEESGPSESESDDSDLSDIIDSGEE